MVLIISVLIYLINNNFYVLFLVHFKQGYQTPYLAFPLYAKLSYKRKRKLAFEFAINGCI